MYHTYLEELRQRGYRITPQREIIIKAIADSTAHLTAEDVLELIRPSSEAINIATVYRTLEMLVEEGLIIRSDLGQGQAVYAPQQHGPHIHLVCRHCGVVVAADYTMADSLKEQILAQYHFEADFTHTTIFGLCAQCQSLTKREA
ncbi:MAG: Fur family transcriptional regulator [Chloroflexota bacterium]|nr:Fur family transcriptional regulator [Chloroflexota bacterium]